MGTAGVMVGPGWSLEEVARMAGGRLVEAGPKESPSVASGLRGRRVEYGGLSLDSRTLRPGEFFVALRGETHDAHDHLDQVVRNGAMGALVDRPLPLPGFPQIVVEDSLAGWQRWSAEHRRAFPRLPVVGLTGSSGKTTAKDILTHLLSAVGPVWATEGNHNNHVGVPWTLLGLSGEHRYAVVEMGMNHAGEITALSRLTAPTAALITDVGTAHVGYLGSRDAILSAKLEILEGCDPSAPLVVPQDPWVLERLSESARLHPLKTFGLDPSADWHPLGPVEWSLSGTRFRTQRTGELLLSPLGPGPFLSALAALAVLDSLGLDAAALAPRLESAPRRALRMEPRLCDGIQWLLDCYNASPESTRLAIRFLREVPHRGRRILVLGELGELGEQSVAIHQDLGRRAGAVETVLFVGEGTRAALTANRAAALASSSAAWFPSAAEAAVWLRSRLRPGDLVLLKGSRRVALERIFDALYPESDPAARGAEGEIGRVDSRDGGGSASPGDGR